MLQTGVLRGLTAGIRRCCIESLPDALSKGMRSILEVREELCLQEGFRSSFLWCRRHAELAERACSEVKQLDMMYGLFY